MVNTIVFAASTPLSFRACVVERILKLCYLCLLGTKSPCIKSAAAVQRGVERTKNSKKTFNDPYQNYKNKLFIIFCEEVPNFLKKYSMTIYTVTCG